ncbi:MAG TPA: hypothetical protein VMG81_00845 [Thermoplasmata archaeon]|nr:hypothetical protein [Thermoplasmata archaeon]
MATSTSSAQLNLTLSSTDIYIGILGLGVLVAALGFVTHTIPSWLGYAGVATTLVTFFQMLVDEFVPATWVEYLAVTIVAAVVGVFGYFTGVQNVDLVTLLAWGLGIASAVYKAVSDTGGTVLSSQQETIALGISGAAVAFLTWWAGDPTASGATIVATLIATVGQFLRVSVQAAPSSASSAASAPPAGATH